jgi:mannose-6-phosphate isomerase-like protein (cupin superfamily)
MSYPDAKYLGEGGEVSAVLRPGDAEPELRVGAVSAAAYLANGATTDGQFGLYRWDMGPAPAGAAPHFHRTMSESFVVVSGAVRFFDGARWFDGRAGDFVYVPEGGIHAFRNESGEPASMLILFVPGAPREEYFETLAAVARGERTITPEELRDLQLRHDNIMV